MIEFRVTFDPEPPYRTYIARFWDAASIRDRAQWRRRRNAAAAEGSAFDEMPPPPSYDKTAIVPATYWKAIGWDVPRKPSDKALHLAIAWASKRRDELATAVAQGRRPERSAPATSPAMRAAVSRGAEFPLEAMLEWYIERNPNDGTSLTIAKYRDCGRRLVTHFGAARLISTITKVDAESYRNAEKKRGLRNKTIKGDLVFLRQLAWDAYQHREITGMKELGLLKLPRIRKQKSQKRPLSVDELRRILGVQLERDGDRVRAIIIRAVTTGLRKFALLNLEETWTDREQRAQRIPGWAMKGGEDLWGDEDFEVPICQWAVDATPRPRQGSRWNFANPRTGQPNKQLDTSLWEIARKAEGCAAASIEACHQAQHEHRWFCLQELRMTFATILADAGVEQAVREILLGHRPANVSEESYIRRSPDVLRTAVAVFDRLRREIEAPAARPQLRRVK